LFRAFEHVVNEFPNVSCICTPRWKLFCLHNLQRIFFLFFSCFLVSVSFLDSKTAIRSVYLPYTHLKDGVNSRQCAARGISILEASIKKMGWVDGEVFVTVHSSYEAQFRDAMPHHKMRLGMELTGQTSLPGYDATLATWLTEECRYVLVDGHHRVVALTGLWASNLPGLPLKIRYAFLQDWQMKFLLIFRKLKKKVTFPIMQLYRPARSDPLGQVCAIGEAEFSESRCCPFNLLRLDNDGLKTTHVKVSFTLKF
jgi:hypothetical protein